MHDNSLNQVKALLFDLDGTIVDNSSVHYESWRRVGELFGIEISYSEYKKNYVNNNTREVLTHVWGGAYSDQEIRDIMRKKLEIYSRLISQSDRLVEGFKNFALTAQSIGLHIGLVSNASPETRTITLEAAGISRIFKVIVGPELGLQPKPDPAMYNQAAFRLGMEPQECVVFEDTPSGVESGVRAGMKVVGITTSHQESALRDAEITVSNFKRLHLCATGKILSNKN